MSMNNQAQLIGRLGADPQVNYAPDGQMIANLRVATDESYKNQDGDRIQRTEWHRVVMFGKIAEIANDYLSKGRLVGVSGKLRTRKWTDQDKIDRYTTEIVAFDLKMLDSKTEPKNDKNVLIDNDEIPF